MNEVSKQVIKNYSPVLGFLVDFKNLINTFTSKHTMHAIV